MIDKEPYIIQAVAQYVTQRVQSFASAFVLESPTFPKVTVSEIGNVPATRFRSSADIEDMSILTYEVNIYSMSKLECRELAALVNDAMDGMNFTRDTGQFVPNLADRNIFRYVGRYRVSIDLNGIMYRTRQ